MMRSSFTVRMLSLATARAAPVRNDRPAECSELNIAEWVAVIALLVASAPALSTVNGVRRDRRLGTNCRSEAGHAGISGEWVWG
jgi:hypothetical protein